MFHFKKVVDVIKFYLYFKKYSFTLIHSDGVTLYITSLFSFSFHADPAVRLRFQIVRGLGQGQDYGSARPGLSWSDTL